MTQCSSLVTQCSGHVTQCSGHVTQCSSHVTQCGGHVIGMCANSKNAWNIIFMHTTYYTGSHDCYTGYNFEVPLCIINNFEIGIQCQKTFIRYDVMGGKGEH